MFGRGDDSYIQEHQLKTSNVAAEGLQEDYDDDGQQNSNRD